MGEPAAARRRQEEALALYRQLGYRFGAGVVLNGLGYLERHEGNAAAAHARHLEALELFEALTSREGIAYCLRSIAELLSDSPEPERAARLFGAAEALS